MTQEKNSLPGIMICLSAVCGLTLAGYFFPSALTWGFHFLAFLPFPYFIAYALLAVGLFFYAFRGNADRHVSAVASFMQARPALFLSVIISGFIGATFLFRVSAPLLGDSFYLVRNFAESFRGEADLYYRNEPLSTYLLSAFMKALDVKTYAGFLNAFFSAEILLAVPTIIFLFVTVKQLFRDSNEQLLSFCFLLAFPGMQLFFGYVEIYAVVICFSALYLFFVSLYLNKKLRFSLVALSFVIMVFSHFATLLLFPSLCYLAYLELRQNGFRDVVIGSAIIIAIVIFAAIITEFDPNRYSAWVPHSHILPLSEPAEQADQYTSAFTLFSAYHAADVANLFILMAPCALVILFSALFSNRASLFASRPHVFFITALIPALIVLLVIKYDLGGARDWDVFSFVFLILFLYSAVVVFASGHSNTAKIFVLVIGVTLLNSLTFFSVNAGKESGEHRYWALFDKRVFSRAAFYNGSLYLAQYYHQTKNTDGPLKVWQRYNNEFPVDERGYGNMYTNMVLRDSSTDEQKFSLLEEWISAHPSSATARATYSSFCDEAGRRYYEQGKLAFAERIYKKAIDLRPASAEAHNNFGSVLAEQGKLDKAMEYFSRAITLDSNYADAYFNLANVYIERGNKKDGIRNLRLAEQLGNTHAEKALQEFQK